jgi:hypothetical protein
MTLVRHACEKLLSLLSMVVATHRQESQNGRKLSWAQMDHAVPGDRRTLNHQIFVSYLQVVGQKAPACRIGLNWVWSSTVARKLHRQLSTSINATLLRNSSVKPTRSSQDNCSDIQTLEGNLLR